ncbi:hypothetical protein KI387_042918, partial [Taxus chinensis]
KFDVVMGDATILENQSNHNLVFRSSNFDIESYTMSLTSMLTVQQMKPSIASVDFVKYRGLLLEALSKGPRNGGVVAIIDEIPYICVFLSNQYEYMMVEPIYKTSEDDEMKHIETKYFDFNMCTNPTPI